MNRATVGSVEGVAEMPGFYTKNGCNCAKKTKLDDAAQLFSTER
jgi:hypothetical protein